VVWAVSESAGSGSKELLHIPDVEAARANVLAQLLWVLHSQQPRPLSLLPLPLLLHNTALHMAQDTVRKGCLSLSTSVCSMILSAVGKYREVKVQDTSDRLDCNATEDRLSAHSHLRAVELSHLSLDQSAIDDKCVKSSVFTQVEYPQRHSIQSACAFAEAAAEAGLAWTQIHGRTPYLTHADSMAAVVKATPKALKEASQQIPCIFFRLLRGWYQAAPEARAGASWQLVAHAQQVRHDHVNNAVG